MLEAELVGFDLGEIEDVVQQTQQVLRRVLDFLEVIDLSMVELGPGEQVAHADDGIHRRPDFVAHVGQEVGLGLRGVFGQMASLFQFGVGERQFVGAFDDPLLQAGVQGFDFMPLLLGLGDVSDDGGEQGFVPHTMARNRCLDRKGCPTGTQTIERCGPACADGGHALASQAAHLLTMPCSV